MPNLTTNYQLEKPLGTENYDINVHNKNMDKIDAKVKEIDTKVDNVKNEVSSMEFVSTKVIRPNKQTVEASLVANETSILNQGKEIESLKQSVSSGKTMIASSITDRGITTSNTDTFKVMSDNILRLPKINNVLGVRVDISNSNPNTSVYPIEGSSSGSNWYMDRFPFNKIKPCGFLNGRVVKYINQKDFTKYEDGTSVGDDVDIMIEFPKIFWKFTSTSEGYEIRVSETKLDQHYICPAHTIGNVEVDNIYIGAYLGVEENGKLRSKHNVYPISNISIDNSRLMCQANGIGYQQFNYYSAFMLQILYLIMYQNLDSQSCFAYGFANNNTGKIKTGGTSTKGMLFGENTGKLQMKFLGIEDLWGNLYQWCDGILTNSNIELMISDNSVFNNTGVGYENFGKMASSSINGYIRTVHGGTKTGFIPTNCYGSSSTYYTDSGAVAINSVAFYGGYYKDNTNAGVFSNAIYRGASTTLEYIGSRLIYIGL